MRVSSCRRLVALSVTFATAAIGLWGCDDSGDGGDDAAGERVWHEVQASLPGAILSIWASARDDIWVAGADPSDGLGPMVMHFDGADWERLETGASGHLWWVFGAADGALWLTGEGGKILTRKPGESDFEAIDSPTDATLYGVWGPPGGPLYAVGGLIVPERKPGVIVRIEGGVATLVDDLPADVNPKEAYFKVWGTGPDDVWVIGDKGAVLHFDGSAWTQTVLDGSPRLVTLHGSGADDMVVVGGISQPVVLERGSDGAWTDASPDPVSGSVNGVFVKANGEAAAAGMRGGVFERGDEGWTPLVSPPGRRDWHAVWIDPLGDIWVVGGDLGSAAAMNDGAVLRFGPARTSDGAGFGVPLSE